MSAWGRAVSLVRSHGAFDTLSVATSVVEDRYLRVFDRRFGVDTSGYIALEETSLAKSVTAELHRYRGVNAWAFRRMLRTFRPNESLSFVDLGSGLGRACILAADYGFSRVTGVDIVPEFCSVAKRNVDSYVSRYRPPSHVRIVTADARHYTASCDDDVYFLYRPFSGEVLASVCSNIKRRSMAAHRPALLLYSERLVQTDSHHRLFPDVFGMTAVGTGCWWGQRFWAFQV